MDSEKAGRVSGFAFSYAVFTFALYIILLLTGRLPAGWALPHVMFASLLISASGFGLRRWLS